MTSALLCGFESFNPSGNSSHCEWSAGGVQSEDELLAEKKCVAHLIGEFNGVCEIPEEDTISTWRRAR